MSILKGVDNMINLKGLESNLNNLISTMANLTKVEYAIFNTRAELVSSTNMYLKYKGTSVHLASIEEVLTMGNIVVNKPGLMNSCFGCRFINNCPATMEILSCIKLDNNIIGVIALTSFSKEGHNMIEKNTLDYINILEWVSNLISMFAFNENLKHGTKVLHISIDPIVKDKEKDLQPNYLNSIISKNHEIISIKNIIEKISSSPSSVLITGDTGTGKELVAKAIHYTGNRSNNPFISINCANIPETLFESELFGYDEGAFTGAKKEGKPGAFEMANGGTIFLDEIGEVPKHLQSKLLRVLQDNTIQRLGGVKSIPIDIRVISATNQDLESMIVEKEFRDDLFYRLNVIPIHLPPLIERQEDIKILVNHFINKYSIKLNKNINYISKEALLAMESYSWPGNIREVENSIEYAINMEDTETILLKNLPKRIRNSINKKETIREFIAEKESDLIIKALNQYGWDLQGKTKAAEELGISLRTLYRKLN